MIKKHIGKIKNTDKKCVVIFPQLPEEKEYALIVDTDSLPDRFHDALFREVDSKSGQDAFVLADVLSTRLSPDDGIDILNSLHRRGFIQKQKITNIMMYPQPNSPVELSTIVSFKNGEEPVEESNIKHENLIAEAERLEERAKHLRKQASEITHTSKQVEEKAAPTSDTTIDSNLDPELQRIAMEEQRKLEEAERLRIEKEDAKAAFKEKKPAKKRGRPKKEAS